MKLYYFEYKIGEHFNKRCICVDRERLETMKKGLERDKEILGSTVGEIQEIYLADEIEII